MKKIILFCLSFFLLQSIVVRGNFTHPTNRQYSENQENQLFKNKPDTTKFVKGIWVFSVGFGTPNFASSLAKAFNSAGFFGLDSIPGFEVSGFGPLHIKIERAVGKRIGLGLSINYVTNSYKFPVTYTYEGTKYSYPAEFNRSNIAFLFRFSHHFYSTNKLDMYYGIGMGYRKGSVEWNTMPGFKYSYNVKLPISIPYGMELTFGARYYWTKHIATYFEVGPAKSIIQAGMSFQL